jgi:hypothetical protein
MVKNGFKWVVLSAKYGVIEPWQPIFNYSVSFTGNALKKGKAFSAFVACVRYTCLSINSHPPRSSCVYILDRASMDI